MTCLLPEAALLSVAAVRLENAVNPAYNELRVETYFVPEREA